MGHNEVMQLASGGNTIDSIIKTVNKLHSAIQLQHTDEGEDTQERMIQTSKSINSEIRVERTIEMPSNSDGTALNRTKSAPPLNLTDSANQIRKLQATLRRLKRNLKSMMNHQLDIETELEKRLEFLNKLVDGVKPSVISLTNTDLEDITSKFLDLIRKVPVSVKKQNKKKALPDDLDEDGSIRNRRRIVCLQGIHADEEKLQRLAVYKYVQRKFLQLTVQQRICLLSFAVFPENQEVNRTMLMYWWIGEGIVLADKPNPENVVKDILNHFTQRNLIEPVENKRKVEPNSYKMAPFVHASVVLISKEMKLFDMYRKGEKPTMKQSGLNKVCLVAGSSSQPDAKANKMKNVDQIETVFNVSERFPEYTCKWFTRMKKLKVLYLGRWERTDREIEMDSHRVMKNLSSLKRSRFLSFQGISTIKSLSRSVCKLSELIILDLRDCYNLEQLPDDIKKLRSLVYLDLTGCEALESVPLGLALLNNLEVLKGFVLGDVETANTCKLKALKRLVRLRKLSVTIHRKGFHLYKLLDDIKDLNGLEKLKVRWGSKVSLKKKQEDKDYTQSIMTRERDDKPSSQSGHDLAKRALPTGLRKLDLQRFPDSELPEWLQPQNLIHLEKLYLGSSRRLRGFVNFELPIKPTDCNVKVLRLKSLLKLKVAWTELRQLFFPKMEFLECYECPRVTFCPCDRNGIWRSDENDDSTTTI